MRWLYVIILLLVGWTIQICGYAWAEVSHSPLWTTYTPVYVQLGAEEVPLSALADLPGEGAGVYEAPGRVALTDAERTAIAQVVAAESSYFPDQLGVAQTIKERMRFYSDFSVGSLLASPAQFAAPRPATADSLRAVGWVFDLGVEPMSPAPTHFANLSLCSPSWAKRFTFVRDLGAGTAFFRNEEFNS
jgi:hypothetical protein